MADDKSTQLQISRLSDFLSNGVMVIGPVYNSYYY